METIGNITDGFLDNGEQQDRSTDDYTGEDGLLYCGKCHTPKQMRTDENIRAFTGSEFFPILCKCQSEQCVREEREREERLAEQERQRTYSEWLSRCFVNLDYRKRTFEDSKDYNPELIKTAQDFVERFDYPKGAICF